MVAVEWSGRCRCLCVDLTWVPRTSRSPSCFLARILRSLVHSSVHSFVRSFIHSFVRSFVRSFVAATFAVASEQVQWLRSPADFIRSLPRTHNQSGVCPLCVTSCVTQAAVRQAVTARWWLCPHELVRNALARQRAASLACGLRTGVDRRKRLCGWFDWWRTVVVAVTTPRNGRRRPAHHGDSACDGSRQLTVAVPCGRACPKSRVAVD